MARGRVGLLKRRMARRAFTVLRRARLPRPVAKAGANRVGQVVRPVRRRRSRPLGRKSYRRTSYRRRRRY